MSKHALSVVFQFLLVLLIISCGARNKAVLLYDNSFRAILNYEKYSDAQIKRSFASRGYLLEIISAPLLNEDSNWSISSVEPLSSANLILLSPLLNFTIQELFLLIPEGSTVVYLGADTRIPAQYRSLVRGLQYYPNLEDSTFLEYLADENDIKAMIIDPQFMSNYEAAEFEFESLTNNYVVTRPNAPSNEVILEFRRFANTVDHIIAIVDANSLVTILNEYSANSAVEPQLIASGSIPAEFIIGGFPSRYSYVLPALIDIIAEEQAGADRDSSDSSLQTAELVAETTDIQIPLPFELVKKPKSQPTVDKE